MYIKPFWCGVIFTVLVEIIVTMLFVIKLSGKEKNDEQ